MTATKDARSPAEIYDAQFVPALFAQWGSRRPRRGGPSLIVTARKH